MLKKLMVLSLFSLVTQGALAQVVCDTAAMPEKPTQLSCGADRMASFVTPSQKVNRVVISISDSARGLEQRVNIAKINQPFSKLDAKNIATNPLVKAEIAKLQKQWNAKSVRVEVLSYEFDSKAQFFTGTDKKMAIPVAKLTNTQLRSTASAAQPAAAGGIRK